MAYSIFKYGFQKKTGIEDLERANEEALSFVTPITGSEYVEVQDSDN